VDSRADEDPVINQTATYVAANPSSLFSKPFVRIIISYAGVPLGLLLYFLYHKQVFLRRVQIILRPVRFSLASAFCTMVAILTFLSFLYGVLDYFGLIG